MSQQNRNRLLDTENKLCGLQTGVGGVGGWVKKVKGLRTTDW